MSRAIAEAMSAWRDLAVSDTLRAMSERDRYIPSRDDLCRLPEVMRVVTLAERWGCSDGKVRALLKKGVLPALDLDGLVRIPIAAVRTYEAACEMKPRPAPAEAEAAADAVLREAALRARARSAARRSQPRKEP